MDTPPKPEEPEQPEPALTRKQIMWSLVGMLFLLALPFPFVWWKSDAPSEYGALLQGLAGTAALALLLLTLHLQRRELHLQREELRNQRKEMQANTAEQAGQRQILERTLTASVRPILRADVTPSGGKIIVNLRNVGAGTAYVRRIVLVNEDGVAEPFFRTIVMKLRELKIQRDEGILDVDPTAVVPPGEPVHVFTFPYFLGRAKGLTVAEEAFARWITNYSVSIEFEDINGGVQTIVVTSGELIPF